MKFRTSCFVRVEDVEKRKDLIKWCEAEIGRNGGFPVGANYIVGEFVLCIKDVTYCCNRGELISMIDATTIDCGENIELVKALAAMNDENDYMQLFINKSNRYRRVLCNTQRLFDAVAKECDWRKATAAEIVEHFKK